MKFYQWNLQMINLIKISLMLLAQPPNLPDVRRMICNVNARGRNSSTKNPW